MRFLVTLLVYAVLGAVLGVLAAWLDIPWKMLVAAFAVCLAWDSVKSIEKLWDKHMGPILREKRIEKYFRLPKEQQTEEKWMTMVERE